MTLTATAISKAVILNEDGEKIHEGSYLTVNTSEVIRWLEETINESPQEEIKSLGEGNRTQIDIDVSQVKSLIYGLCACPSGITYYKDGVQSAQWMKSHQQCLHFMLYTIGNLIENEVTMSDTFSLVINPTDEEQGVLYGDVYTLELEW